MSARVFVTVKQWCVLFGRCEKTVWTYCKKGLIPAKKDPGGRGWIIEITGNENIAGNERKGAE